MPQPQLIVRTGCMFTEKTEGLIAYLRKSTYTGKKMAVIIPTKDTREERNIKTRIEKDWELGKYENISIHSINSFGELKELVREHKPDIIAIDEIHLFANWLPQAVKELMEINDSKDFVLITAGLDMDYLGKPFESTIQLMGMATEVKKETTTCFKCKKRQATMTYKVPGSSDKRIEVGGFGLYEARCRSCHKLPE